MLGQNRKKVSKLQKGRLRGKLSQGACLVNGSFGIKIKNNCYISPRQVEAVRKVFVRKLRELGGGFKSKLWIRVFPHHPVTSKPIGSRMGKGKGKINSWFCKVKAGQVLFEWENPSLNYFQAKSFEFAANSKLPANVILVSSDKY